MVTRTLRRPGLAVAVVSLALAACGATPQPSPGASPSPSAGPGTPGPGRVVVTADPDGWHAQATVGGGDVDVRLTVPGPLQVEGGCIPPLGVWLEDSSRRTVAITPSPGGPHCLALAIIDVPAGTTHDFDARLHADVPHGRYTVHGLLMVSLPPGAGARVRENLPVLTVDL